MSLTASSFSFRYQRDPSELALALAKWTDEAAGPPPSIYVSADDNGWAASRFLVELLLHAKPRRRRLDRERTREILHAAGSSITPEQLEQRFWLRFVFERLEIPHAVQDELRLELHKAKMPEAERFALKTLHAARYDKAPLFWVECTELERMYAAHASAHRHMPSLAALVDARVFVPAEFENVRGYNLLAREGTGACIWSELGDRVLGFYWEELARETSLRADESSFRVWLMAAAEIRRWPNVARHIAVPWRNRILKAAQRCILAEEDVVDPGKELKRVIWEEVGFRYSGQVVEAPFPHDGSLLDIHRWYCEAHLHDSRGLHPCRGQIDGSLSFVIISSDDPWQSALVDILQAGRERPYLMYSALMLLPGRSAAGLIAHVATASLGMQRLAEISVSMGPTVDREDFTARWQAQEHNKTTLWRGAVVVLLGTLHDGIEVDPRGAAKALTEILVLAARTNPRSGNNAVLAAIEKEGAEDRLSVLFEELAHTREFVLLPLAPDVHQFLVQSAGNRHSVRPAYEKMPVAEIRVLLWLLRTLAGATGAISLSPATVAEGILTLYCEELLRERTADGTKVVSWIGDASGADSLPWADLAIFLHRRGLAHRFIQPEEIDFESRISSSLETDEYRGGDVCHSWIRKARLHLRILMAVHEELLKQDFDPIVGLPATQLAELVSFVEERIGALVCGCVVAVQKGDRLSLFDIDIEPYGGGAGGTEALLDSLVRAINRFSSAAASEQAFSDWVAVENDLNVLLTILDDALPSDAKRQAAKKIEQCNIAEFLETRRSATQLKQLASAANAAAQVEIVKKVLSYGQVHLNAQYRENEWAMFAYKMQLMLAYHNKDEAELDAVPLPPKPETYRIHIDDYVQDEVQDEREFYRGLIVLERRPDSAGAIFGDLVKRYPGSAAYVINYAVAVLQAAKKIEDPEARRQAFLKVRHDWDAVESSLTASALTATRINVAWVRLAALDGAERDADFDATWERLDTDQRASIAIVTLAVDNARRRGLEERAKDFLRHARPFHVSREGKLDETFEKLERSVDRSGAQLVAPAISAFPDDIEVLYGAHARLVLSPAHKAVQVVRGRGFPTHRFVMDVLREAAREVLKREVLFSGTQNENKRNDLLVSLLQMRVAFLNWSVQDQSRGGVSVKDAGERDWVICNPRGDGELAIFEAMELHHLSVKVIDDHVDRAIFKYDRCGLSQAYIIVYYGGDASWDDFWQKYSNHVRTTAVRGLLPREVPEAEFFPRVNNIRIVSLEYIRDGEPLVVYHMVLNLKR